MPVTKYKPNEGHYEVVECKSCGACFKILPGQKRVFKIRCRTCGGTRFRTVKE